MSKKLTHEFIAMRTKCDRLESIRNLNLWGNDLEDISIIRTMHNLEVVSLSVNKIRTLKDFASLKNLRELYLRKNSISDINEIRYLTNLPNLKILWLSENPVAEIKGYRGIVIRNLPQITKLDDNVISLEERESCDQEQGSNNYKEDPSSQDEEQQFEIGKSEDNVFENQNFSHDNQDKNYQVPNVINSNNNYNEIYSNNEKNRKLKDKFNYQNQNNPSVEIRKKNSVNYEDNSNIVQNFENLNIKKRNTTANTNNVGLENKYEIHNMLQKNPSQNSQNRQMINNDNYSGPNIQNHNLPSSRPGNILNCVLMLLKELNDNELEIIKSEVDKKLARY
jgi:hypothetical protein